MLLELSSVGREMWCSGFRSVVWLPDDAASPLMRGERSSALPFLLLELIWRRSCLEKEAFAVSKTIGSWLAGRARAAGARVQAQKQRG